LLEEQWISLRTLNASGQNRRRASGERLRELQRFALAQRPQVKGQHANLGSHAGAPYRAERIGVGASGEHQQHAVPLNPGRDFGEHVQERLVGPVNVLCHDQSRCAFGCAMKQPYYELAPLARACCVVHLLIDCTQLRGQGNGEEVPREHCFVARH